MLDEVRGVARAALHGRVVKHDEKDKYGDGAAREALPLDGVKRGLVAHLGHELVNRHVVGVRDEDWPRDTMGPAWPVSQTGMGEFKR